MSAASKNRFITLSNGKKMPIIGLGTWKSKPNEVHDAVVAAVKAGYRHIDTAFLYRNESEVGDALQELFKEGIVRREDIFITTKMTGIYHAPSRVKEAIELSLKALKLDYLDLYLMHSPMAFQDPAEEGNDGPIPPDGEITHYLDTWKAMETLVDEGLAKSIGVSNFNVSQLETLLNAARVPCVVNQFENHPGIDQQKLITLCKSKNVAVTSYSPFGSPDRSWASDKDPSLLKSPVVKEIADAKGCNIGQVLIAYHLCQGLICIPKSINPSRIQGNFLSLDVKLSSEDIKKLDSLECNFRAVPWQWFTKHPHYPF